MKKKILLGSHNKKKSVEMRHLLEPLGIEVITPDMLGITDDVPETGSTFEENAVQKASGYARLSGMAAIADDSGICVDALDGRPGIYSARYGDPSLDDQGRMMHLLDEMEGIPPEKRGAAYVSAIAFVLPDGRSFTVRGECRGSVLLDPQGDGGFGYDPVFFLPDYGMTFAEMPEDEKNKISHRGNAMRLFIERIVEFDW